MSHTTKLTHDAPSIADTSASKKVKRVLHVAGSSEDAFSFRVSYLYAAKVPLLAPNMIYDYVLLTPIGEWYFVQNPHAIAGHLGLDNVDFFSDSDFLNGEFSKIKQIYSGLRDGSITGPMSFSQLIHVIEVGGYDLHVPHMFDLPGMTTWRQMFEDVLGLPYVGPTSFTNSLCQDKAMTRDFLKNVPGVQIPAGQTLHKTPEKTIKQMIKDGEIILPLPFVVKPATQDNSRGISLVRENDEIKIALEKAFSYGSKVVLEEFIPGKEYRCGVLEIGWEGNESNERKTRSIDCLIEYVMANPDMPIRTESDKLNADKTTGTLKQTKCERVMNGQVSPTVREGMVKAALAAHTAFNSRDYSLYDFRVHEKTGEAYIIEVCSFWSFTPVSAISLMLQNQEEDWKQTVLGLWERAARRGPASPAQGFAISRQLLNPKESRKAASLGFIGMGKTNTGSSDEGIRNAGEREKVLMRQGGGLGFERGLGSLKTILKAVTRFFYQGTQ